MILHEIEARLMAAQDPEFRVFQSKLMPTVDPACVIGVRTPLLRDMAKEYAKDARIGEFLSDLPHRYFEENNLHAFLIARCRDYDETVRLTNAFLPYINNWATCDQMRPAVFARHLDALRGEIVRWTASDHVYTIRFGIEMLMNFYLGDAFDADDLAHVAAIRHDDYYVKMMVAWYFATALAKQWDKAVPYLAEHRLEKWTHNKTISKAIESYRITEEQKTYLRSLKG